MSLESGSDWAGCPRTRRSTTGGCLMVGAHAIKHWSSTQTGVALSSGEAEFYGLVSNTAATLGLISILKDWGWIFRGQVLMDATAAIAIGSRRGLGKIKHIDTAYLWVQHVYNEGKLTLGKRDTKSMLADFLTKAVDETTILRCLPGLGMHFEEGFHKMALKA